MGQIEKTSLVSAPRLLWLAVVNEQPARCASYPQKLWITL